MHNGIGASQSAVCLAQIGQISHAVLIRAAAYTNVIHAKYVNTRLGFCIFDSVAADESF